jgi:hypothetical protein
MVKYLMHLRRKDPSGGKMCLNYLISLEGLHPTRWGMDPLFSFGLMFGMITSFNTSFQDCTLLLRIKTFHLLHSCIMIQWKHNFTYLSKNKLSRNTSNFNGSSNKFKFQRIAKTRGITSGGTPPIQLPNSIISPTRMSIPLSLLCGYGILNVLTR